MQKSKNSNFLLRYTNNYALLKSLPNTLKFLNATLIKINYLLTNFYEW